MNNLSEFIFQSKYSRYRPELGRKETWNESVERIAQMHMDYLFEQHPNIFENVEFASDFIDAIDLYKNKRILGSQRALQFGGEPILKKHTRLFNCSFTYCDRLSVFKEIEWVLLCGVGVGISVEQQHIDKLPEMNQTLETEHYIHVIEDSIEGWAHTIDALINYYFKPNRQYPKFDYSQVRPEGSFISGGFLAPGPKGLKKALQKVEERLEQTYHTTKRLSALDCSDIIGYLADSVLSGGVRRSAVSILFSPDNEDMKKCKTGNWFYDNPQRARFNMSAVLERGETPYKIYTELFKDIKEYGEPGFVWRSKNTIGYNPCFEIGFEPIYEGQVGWQFCNLATINGGLIETEVDFYECCKAVSTLATIQATYNKFDFLGDITEKLAKADPLIGISITGIVSNPDVLLNEKILKNGANIVKEQNKKIAKILGINYASRTTCIKPEGTSSLLLNTTSGCHGEHARNYIRRVQVNKTEEIAEIYKKYNPNAVVDSVWSANNTDYCVMFPVTTNNRTLLKEDLYGIKQLVIVKSLFTNWVLAGMNDSTSPVQNNVSNTVIVPEDEWDDVMEYVWNNQYSFAGISFIPQTGDLDFNQPPYTEVLMPNELLNLYGNGIIFASGLIVDAEKVFGDLWTACDQFLGKGEKLYSTEEDAIEFLKEYNIENDDSYLDRPYREYKEASILQYNKWYDLLTDMGYPEDFVEPVLDNDLQCQIPIKEFQNYLDKTTIHNVSRLSEKRDIMRRFKKFACKYFDCDEIKMIYALKHVQLYHDWCAITKDEKIIDWSTIKWKKVLTNADETAAIACSGGSCEITKI